MSGGHDDLAADGYWVVRAFALKPKIDMVSPTGDVTFYTKAPDGDWESYDTQELVDGVATSDSYTPDSVGTWYFKAVYEGDDVFIGSESGEEVEPLIVSSGVTQYKVSFYISGLDSDARSNTILTVGSDTYVYANFPVDNIMVDEGTSYSWTDPVTVSGTEQFVQTAGSDGTISGAGTIEATYQKQWYVTFSATGFDSDAGTNTVLTLGGTYDHAWNALPSNVWIDDGTSYSWASTVAGGASKQFLKT